MKKIFSIALIVIGAYLTLTNIGNDAAKLIIGVVLAAIGAIMIGSIKKKEQDDEDKKYWPDDKEY